MFSLEKTLNEPSGNGLLLNRFAPFFRNACFLHVSDEPRHRSTWARSV